LKAQPSTTSEGREDRARTIAVGLEKIGGVVRDCTGMLEQELEVVRSLQEDQKI